MRKPNAAGESNRDNDGDGRVCDGVRDDGCYRDASLLKIVLSLMKRKGSIYLNENIHTPI